MRKNGLFSLIVLSLVAAALPSRGQDLPEMPQPTKEHKWLSQLAGEWETEGEMNMPGQPPMKSTGTESGHMLGGFWYIGEGETTMMDMKAKSVLTLGYDPAQKKFVGTWIDSMMGYLWSYEGGLDESGKVLTLETRGPCMLKGGEMTNFRETIEIKDKDTRVFTSSQQDEGGNWRKMATMTYRRKK